MMPKQLITTGKNAAVKKQQLQSAFSNAIDGLIHFFRGDRNGRIHLGVAIAVILAGFTFHVSAMEWIILIGCIAAVIALEMINAAIEKLCDMVHEEFHATIKYIKDVSAAAVLFVAAASVVAGTIIFIPKIILLL